jgi:uncharacterized protein (TIGR02996 family)
MANPQHPEPNPDEQALLAAVIAHPDEDTPRLMYADWLQEHAETLPGRDPNEVRARAEFIRAQIEAGRFPPGDANAKALRARVVDLVERYGQPWCEYGVTAFVRGFPAAIYCHYLSDICGQAAHLLSRYPIRVLYADEAFLRDTEDEAGVVSSPHFAQLTGLGSTSRGWDGDRVARVLTNPHLANLRLLDFFCGSYNRTEGARGIAAAPHLTNLLVLDLSQCEIQNEGLEALAGAPHLASLRALRLGRGHADFANDITEAGVAALTRSKRFPSLTQLTLDGNEIGTDGVRHILNAEWAGNLTELNVADAWIAEPGLLALAQSQRLTNLRRLDVSANEVTEAVAQAFLQSESFPNLTDLHLIHHHSLEEPLTEATQVALRKRFGSGVIGQRYPVSTAICIEDKIGRRMRDLSNRPSGASEDCEVV